MSTTEDYKAAMNELANATKDFQPYATFLRQITTATGHSIDNFLASAFGLKIRTHGYDHMRYRVNINEWPSRDDLAAAGKRLSAAFNNAHKIYEALPAEDREYIKAPPYRPDVKY
jgi:hypothetical protein